MSKSLRSFIRELQQLDEAAKKRWLVSLSAISIIIIVIAWIMYLNATIKAVDDPTTAAEPGAWDIFKTGLQVLGEKTEAGLANSYLFFYNKANTGNQFTIEK